MDLSKLSTEDLQALQGGDLAKVSTEGLRALNGAGAAPSADPPELAKAKERVQTLGNVVAGAVRGAGSIGATLLAPVDAAARAVGVQNDYIGRTDRREMMDAGLRSAGADTDSLAFKGGKLGAEVAGTAGVGGALANGARTLGAAPAFVDALASGGMAGGGNMLTRIAGGAATGGASAGMIDPTQAGWGAVAGGALPPVVKAAGAAGNALSEAAKGGARKLMQSAIKPTIAQRASGEADTAIDTLLQYGISPTKAGVAKLESLIDDLNNQIAGKIQASSATVDRQKVLGALGDVRQKFTTQAAPTKDLGAIQAVADDFAAHPAIASDAIPVQQAQELKQGTYRVLAKKYGEVGSAETEAQKGLARGLKDEIAAAVPGVDALNAQESKLLTTLSVAERRALLEANKNPMGLAALSHNPLGWAAFMADRSAAFKALAARMVNASAPAQGVASQKLLQVAQNPLLRTTGIVATEASP